MKNFTSHASLSTSTTPSTSACSACSYSRIPHLVSNKHLQHSKLAHSVPISALTYSTAHLHSVSLALYVGWSPDPVSIEPLLPWLFTSYTHFKASSVFTEVIARCQLKTSTNSLLSAESALRCRVVPLKSLLNSTTPTSSVSSLNSPSRVLY